VIVLAFLRFGLASEAAIINFEIRRRKQKQVCGSLVPNTLHDGGFNSGERNGKKLYTHQEYDVTLHKISCGNV
jgi:hypothetical protein